MGWEKRVKVMNLPIPTKKCSTSLFAKPKPAKKGDNSSETCSDIVPFEGDLLPISDIVLESSPPPSARIHSSKRPTVSKSSPAASRPSVNAPLSSRTQGSKRKTSPPPSSTTIKRRVCNF